MKKNKSKLAIFKYSGAGNDFLIVDLRKSRVKISKQKRKALVVKNCDRHFGIGADGLMFLEKPKNKKNHFAWDFYNQDGSSAEACLNASRCATLYEHEQNKKNKISFETRTGTIEGRLTTKDLVEVQMPFVKNPQGKRVLLKIPGKMVRGYYVDSGVPHLVIYKKNFDAKKEKELATQLRWHKKLKPRGANITFWERLNKSGDIRAITFERGVEGFTLACGTGAAAIGLMFERLAQQHKTLVKMPGGRLLVQILAKEKKILIKGPAQRIFYEIV